MSLSEEELIRRELSGLRHQDEAMSRVLGMIHRMTELLSQKLSVDEACRRLVRIVVEETDFENSSIALWDPGPRCLRLAAACGLKDILEEGDRVVYHQELVFTLDQEIAGRVFASREPIFIEDTAQCPIPEKVGAVVHPVALLCLPLLDLGVLNVSASVPRPFLSRHRRNWTLMGNVIAQVLLTASLNERLRDLNSHLRHEVDEKTQELAQRNRELTAANQFLERTLDHAPEGVCLLDARGLILRVSRNMEHFFGDHRSEGRSPGLFFENPADFERLLRRVEGSEQARLEDVHLLDVRGELHVADVFLSRLSDETGRVLGYLLILHDITEKKVLAEQLLRTEKMATVGTVAAGLAHDFNNLLMMILGHTQLLRLDIEEPEAQRRLEHIESAAQEAAQALRLLQTFATEHPPQEEGRCAGGLDVNGILREVVDLTRPSWKHAMERHGQRIEVRFELEAGCVAAVPASDLREVLTNLILNAVDAMPQGGVLTLSSRCEGENILVGIADTGLGIPEAVRRRIFDPFFTTKGVGNSGLGLSVAWSLVNRYAGDVCVDSKAGAGSHFRIRLPAAQLKPQGNLLPASTPLRSTRRLLVVDDDESVLQLLRDMIRLAGHRVVAVQDPEEALRLIDNEAFDLVLTDLGMPGVSGLDLVRRVKARDPQVPVILFTGWEMQHADEEVREHGVDLVLTKPLGYERLNEALKKLL